jgi:peptidoglycan/xylan/chitin deacetylase (PgdA/CDA1 family)
MRSRLVGTVAVSAAAALTMSCGPGVGASRFGSSGSITVNGEALSAAGVHTVEAALAKASAAVTSGALLSVVKHQRVGADGMAGQVLLNGVVSTVDAAIDPGDSVRTVDGKDAVELTRTSDEHFSAVTSAHLYVGSRPGVVRVVRGAVSGEVVRSRVLSRPVLGHLPTPGAVALTFDDGPDPTWTPQVLHQLALSHARATFCLIGRQAAQYPELVRAIVAGGHTLCNHTWDHDEGLPHRSRAQIESEMTRAQAAITQASGGIAPRLFRAPGGNWSGQVEAAARSLHMTPLKWTVDPRDWARPGASAILGVTFAQLRPGGVVLLHDGGGKRDETVAALHRLLLLLPAMHYTYAQPQP